MSVPIKTGDPHVGNNHTILLCIYLTFIRLSHPIVVHDVFVFAFFNAVVDVIEVSKKVYHNLLRA